MIGSWVWHSNSTIGNPWLVRLWGWRQAYFICTPKKDGSSRTLQHIGQGLETVTWWKLTGLFNDLGPRGISQNHGKNFQDHCEIWFTGQKMVKVNWRESEVSVRTGSFPKSCFSIFHEISHFLCFQQIFFLS